MLFVIVVNISRTTVQVLKHFQYPIVMNTFKHLNYIFRLSSTHMMNACKSKHLCEKFQQRHHTLLHFQLELKPTVTTDQEVTLIDGGEVGSTNTKFSGLSASGSIVLLGTAIV